MNYIIVLMGAEVITILLTRIINSSIESGIFQQNGNGSVNPNTQEKRPKGKKLQTCELPGCSINIVQTFHWIIDHFIAVKITAHLLHPVTKLFPLSQLTNSVTYNKYIFLENK